MVNFNLNINRCKFIRLIVFNILSCLLALFLLAILDSGGTGDVYENSGLINIYLVIKSLGMIIYAMIGIVHGVYKRSISISAVFWFLFGILIFALNFTLGQPINPPEDYRSWDYDTIKGVIWILYFDCAVGLMYSILVGISLFRRRHKHIL